MRKIFLLTLMLSMTACAHTRIAARELPAEASRLIQLAPREVTYHLDCPLDEVVGHQYLLVVLPFGRISLENPTLHLERHLQTALGESGIRAIPVSAASAQILVSCQEMSLSAYDYLFFRQIVGRIGWHILPGGRSGITSFAVPARVRQSEIKAFAMYPQLEHRWHLVLEEAAREISRSPLWKMGERTR